MNINNYQFNVIMSIKLISIVGTRPQFIKLSPLSDYLKSNEGIPSKGIHKIIHKIIHTGQHFDSNMSNSFFNGLSIPIPDYNLGIHSKSHAVMTAEMLIGIEQILLKEEPDVVIVYGDCDTTLAGALCASKLRIKLVHVEAGLRSFNNDMPEEINRKIVDTVADILCCPSDCAMENLIREGLGDKAFISGNIQIDLLKKSIDKISLDALIKNKLVAKKYVFMTIHRPYNTHPNVLKSILEQIKKTGLTYFFPMHPRTKNIIEKNNIIVPNNIIIGEPQCYIDSLSLMAYSKFVLTDSGGIQPESAFMGTKCITVRSETEWLDSIKAGINILCPNDKLYECIVEHGYEHEGIYHTYTHDLNCSELIVNKIIDSL